MYQLATYIARCLCENRYEKNLFHDRIKYFDRINILLDTICHSDDQREEESREHPRKQIRVCYRDSSLRSE